MERPALKRILYRQYDAHGHSHGWRLAIVLLMCAMVLSGCGGGAGLGEDDPARPAEFRIVSFSPALSRMVVDLGLEQRIVGRTQYCDFLDPATPVVGDLLNVDYERLIDLRPTHVLIQASAGGANPRLLKLCDEHNWKVGQWSSINTIDDIERVVRELPGVLYETGGAEHEAAARRAADLLNEMALALSSAPAPGTDRGESWRGPVLLVYRTEPVGVFGRHTYLSDVLSRLGAENAVEGDGWLELTLEDVARLNPPAMIIIFPDPGCDAEPMDVAGPLADLNIDAARDQRIHLLCEPSALLPSTGIIDVAKEMRKILHALAEPVP